MREDFIILGVCGSLSLDSVTLDTSSVLHLKMLIEHSNCKVVISSFGLFTEDTASKLFKEHNLPEWSTHLATDPNLSILQRIENWLSLNGADVKSFVILDPEDLGGQRAEYPLANYQVMTNFREGINDDMVHLAKQLLDSSKARTFCR